MASRRRPGQGSIWKEERSGYAVWVGQFRHGGQQYQRILGRTRKGGASEGLTRSMAEKALREKRREVESEQSRKPTASPKDDLRLSVAGEAHCRELEEIERRRVLTIEDYRSILEKHLVPFFKERHLDEIKTRDVHAFIAHQAERGNLKTGGGLSSSTISNHVQLLSGIFRTAIRNKRLDVNPVTAARKPRSRRARGVRAFLSPHEVDVLVGNVNDDHLGHTDAAIFLTAAMTGLRRGELVALRWSDVDWAAARIRVRRSRRRGQTTDPKSETSNRSVPMPNRVARQLELHFQRSHYSADDDLVFCNPHTGSHYDPDYLSSRFKATRDRGEVRKITFHELRHTFGTQMAAHGVPLTTLQVWMGHSDIQTTMIYAHYAPAPETEREQIERAFSVQESAELTAAING